VGLFGGVVDRFSVVFSWCGVCVVLMVLECLDLELYFCVVLLGGLVICVYGCVMFVVVCVLVIGC